MVLRKYNTNTSYRYLYGREQKGITLLKRDDDQLQGTVTALQVWNCRRGDITKTGQTLQGDMASSHRCTWYLPSEALLRAGVHYINPLDRIVEKTDDGGVEINPWRYWQPESSTRIEVKLYENFVVVECLRVDPTPPVPHGTNT